MERQGVHGKVMMFHHGLAAGRVWYSEIAVSQRLSTVYLFFYEKHVERWGKYISLIILYAGRCFGDRAQRRAYSAAAALVVGAGL